MLTEEEKKKVCGGVENIISRLVKENEELQFQLDAIKKAAKKVVERYEYIDQNGLDDAIEALDKLIGGGK